MRERRNIVEGGAEVVLGVEEVLGVECGRRCYTSGRKLGAMGKWIDNMKGND